MKRTLLLSVALGGVVAVAALYAAVDRGTLTLPDMDVQKEMTLALNDIQTTAPGYNTTENLPLPENFGVAGSFLASHYAQSQNDWKQANEFLGQVLNFEKDNYDLIKRSMVLAMGYGDLDVAAERAEQLLVLEEDNALALMFLAVHDLGKDDLQKAEERLASMTEGDMTDFIKPLLDGWVEAGLNKSLPQLGDETVIHVYHNALISVYLGDMETARMHTEKLVELGALNNLDAERAADLLAITGDKDGSLKLYEAIFTQDPENKRIQEKLEALQMGQPGDLEKLLPQLQVKRPAEGAAQAMYDMAIILYQEGSDSSAKLFANMALALDSKLTDARILLADALARNERFDEAIAHLKAVPPNHPSYIDSQRHAADLLADNGDMEDALSLLNKLFIEHNDVESLIRTGDLYRQDEKYKNALSAYNKAATQIGTEIPEEYWYLLYARGMAYEREGDWTKAQNDLKAALVYRPNHPYLLNYLGYGWADKGENLEESLELIKKAVSLRPRDGYIIDSLGWVEFMMGKYDDAIPNLERAVELLPYDETINDHLGDAYWMVGRKMEARFQWKRAINSSKDEDFQEKIRGKLRAGLEVKETLRQAKNAEADSGSE